MIGVGGIIASGIIMGSALGTLVNPVPRNLQVEDATNSAYTSLEPSPSYEFVEMGPAELPIPSAADGYAPSWASGDQAWTYPEPDYSPWTPEPFPTLAELDAQLEAERASAELAATTEVAPAEIAPPVPADPPLHESRLAALY
jgi:hypothetical protein